VYLFAGAAGAGPVPRKESPEGAVLMANHPSALKRMRQNEKKRLRNHSYKSKVKTAIKKYLQAVADKSADTTTLLNSAASLLQKGVSKGIYHRNTASRTISRLYKKPGPA
jgi:small subunit ribosomal protein S20